MFPRVPVLDGEEGPPGHQDVGAQVRLAAVAAGLEQVVVPRPQC